MRIVEDILITVIKSSSFVFAVTLSLVILRYIREGCWNRKWYLEVCQLLSGDSGSLKPKLWELNSHTFLFSTLKPSPMLNILWKLLNTNLSNRIKYLNITGHSHYSNFHTFCTFLLFVFCKIPMLSKNSFGP